MGIDTILVEVEEESVPFLKELGSFDLSAFLRVAREAWPTMINASLSVEHPKLPDPGDDRERMAADPAPCARELIVRAISGPHEDKAGNFTISLAQAKKWWEISVSGSSTTVRYGAKKGQAQSKVTAHASNADAAKFARETAEKKKREGYKPQSQPIAAKISKELKEEKKRGKEEEEEEDVESSGPPEKKRAKEEEIGTPEIPQLGGVLTMVLGFLTPVDLARASGVSREWRGAAASEDLWHECFMRSWGSRAHPKRLATISELVGTGKMTWRKAATDQARWDKILSRCRWASLDAAGDAVEYIVHRFCGAPEQELTDIAEVFYGPLQIVMPAQVSELHEAVKGMTFDRARDSYTPDGTWPDVLGGILTKPKRDDDAEFIAWHVLTLKIALANAASRGSALIKYYC